jgi:hypothetical protein
VEEGDHAQEDDDDSAEDHVCCSVLAG